MALYNYTCKLKQGIQNNIARKTQSLQSILEKILQLEGEFALTEIYPKFLFRLTHGYLYNFVCKPLQFYIIKGLNQ